MAISYNVPFYSNTPDDTHCYQASLKMVLKYFQPEKEFSWEALDKLTAKVEGLWTWPMAGMLSLQKFGYEVICIEDFDYEAFAKDGERYLTDTFGEKVAQEQIRHSDIQQEKQYAMALLQSISFQKRVPQLHEIEDLLQKGYLVICNVNSLILNHEEGYVGHFVVIKEITENDDFVIHDPGLPPLENRTIDKNTFEKAWSYPNEIARNIMAFKIIT